MKSKLLFAAVALGLVFACSPREKAEPEDPGTVEPVDPEDPEQPEDPDAPPVWPSPGDWPKDENAFDYEVAWYRTAPFSKFTSAPCTLNGVYYASGMGKNVDKVVFNRVGTTNPGDVVPSQRYISFQVNQPGELSMVLTNRTAGNNISFGVTLKTVKGSKTEVKQIFAKQMPDISATWKYDDNENYRQFIPVTEQMLAGITEPATLYLYCFGPGTSSGGGGQLLGYPFRWNNPMKNPGYNVDAAVASRKEKILNSPNTIDPATHTGKCYFMSNDGDDTNDGRSAARPLKTLKKLSQKGLQAGDAVLFRRGDVWRRQPSTNWDPVLSARKGVIYSAYGEGPKPQILGSPCNAAREGTWTLKSDAPNVYEYSMDFPKGGVGTAMLDGKECAQLIFWSNPSYKNLTADKSCGMVGNKFYLCSTQGNPSQRWSSIELFVAGNCITPQDNVTIDNLCIRYAGAHGIGSGYTTGLTVTNCEVSWIGGALNHVGQADQVRYGNGIQLFGGCDSYVIDNCYVAECYDAGITHQYGEKAEDCIMANIRYTNNLLERNIYNIEYFNPTVEGQERCMRNVLIDRNISVDAGYGWGKQRPGYAQDKLERHIQSWMCQNPAENFVISNNVFARCTAPTFIYVYAKDEASYPTTFNNLCIQE